MTRAAPITLVTEEAIRHRARMAGIEMLERALLAKERGEIMGFQIWHNSKWPEVIDTITLEKTAPK